MGAFNAIETCTVKVSVILQKCSSGSNVSKNDANCLYLVLCILGVAALYMLNTSFKIISLNLSIGS